MEEISQHTYHCVDIVAMLSAAAVCRRSARLVGARWTLMCFVRCERAPMERSVFSPPVRALLGHRGARRRSHVEERMMHATQRDIVRWSRWNRDGEMEEERRIGDGGS